LFQEIHFMDEVQFCDAKSCGTKLACLSGSSSCVRLTCPSLYAAFKRFFPVLFQTAIIMILYLASSFFPFHLFLISLCSIFLQCLLPALRFSFILSLSVLPITALSFRPIAYVHILTAETAVDLDGGLRCGKPTVPCLWPTAVVFHIKIHRAEVQSCCVRAITTLFQVVHKFDCRLVTNETLTNGEQQKDGHEVINTGSGQGSVPRCASHCILSTSYHHTACHSHTTVCLIHTFIARSSFAPAFVWSYLIQNCWYSLYSYPLYPSSFCSSLILPILVSFCFYSL
jgi:hypothetical protein